SKRYSDEIKINSLRAAQCWSIDCDRLKCQKYEPIASANNNNGTRMHAMPLLGALAIISPGDVLLFVILEIIPALDRAPPFFVVAIPLNRHLDRILEAMLRFPTNLALD